MGLATEGIIGTEFEDGAVVFFDMNDDLILALWPKKSLAKDAKVAVSPPSPTEFSIGHNVRSKQEVDAVMKRSEEHTSELQSRLHLVCRLLLEKKKNNQNAPGRYYSIISTREE